jgi:RHS repeat-associated protein
LYQDSAYPGYSHTASYSYDAVSRLAQASATASGSGTVSYGKTYNYDLYGNMSCVPGSSGYCPQVAFHTSTNRINQIGSLPASYDPAGNMTSDGSNTYQWDAEGRLISVNGGSTWSATYNAFGQRVERIGTGGRTEELYDPSGRLLGHLNGANGVWWEEYVPFDGRLLWYYTQATNTSRYFHVNALGSLGLATDQTGASVEEMLYYPFGDRWQNTTGFGWDEKFAQFPQRDEDIQMYMSTFREDNPGLGRWMSPDPLGGDVTNPQSLNRYAYVTNNPTSLTDPLGLYNPFECDPLDPIDCGPPPCDPEVWNDCPPCIPGFGCPPVGGGGGGHGGHGGSGGGGGASAPPGAPPAGQPPLAGGAGSNTWVSNTITAPGADCYGNPGIIPGLPSSSGEPCFLIFVTSSATFGGYLPIFAAHPVIGPTQTVPTSAKGITVIPPKYKSYPACVAGCAGLTGFCMAGCGVAFEDVPPLAGECGVLCSTRYLSCVNYCKKVNQVPPPNW